MHRHGYKGKKLGRERDQRRSLLRGLMESLIIYRDIETTEAKAKALLPYAEKLITTAKKGTLHDRRLAIKKLHRPSTVNMLFDEIAPMLDKRDSGHLRVIRTRRRIGDNAQLARVSFVDDTTKVVPLDKLVAADTKKEDAS